MAATTALVHAAEGSDSVVLAALERHAHHAEGAYATNTARALRADVATFTAWCSGAGLTWLPATADTVAAFVDAMSAEKAPATIRRYVSSIATFHRAGQVPNPCETSEVRLALKRLHRTKGRAQRQAAPLTRGLVDRLMAAAGDGMKGLRDRALLAVAYDTLARRSELVAMQAETVEVGPEGDGTVLIARSKTDQEGEGMVRYLAPDTTRHVQAWTAAASITTGPLFRAVSTGGKAGRPLDAGDVARIYKVMAAAAGMSPAEVAGISGHSSRVGCAVDMDAAGIPLQGVMQAGGWKSPAMVVHYTRRQAARRSGAAKLAVMQDRA